MLPRSPQVYGAATISIAVNPATNELFAYTAAGDGSLHRVSVFAAHASGNVKPTRLIEGSQTGLDDPGFLGTNKIAADNSGRLFVSHPNATIRVFSSNANGNVAPAQIISDATLKSAKTDQGGIAVRSS